MSCKLEVNTTDNYETLVLRASTTETGHVTFADVKEWYGNVRVTSFPGMGTRLDMAVKLVNAKNKDLEGLGDFMKSVNCLIHLIFMRGVDAGTTVKKHVSKTADNILEAMINARSAASDKSIKYQHDGLSLFDIALQLEIIFANTPEIDHQPFIERVKSWTTKDKPVFEIELVRALSNAFGTFRIAGDNFRGQVVTIATNDEMHWMAMKELVNAKEGSVLYTLLNSKMVGFESPYTSRFSSDKGPGMMERDDGVAGPGVMERDDGVAAPHTEKVDSSCMVPCSVCEKVREGVSLFDGMHFDCVPCSVCGKGREGVGLINGSHHDCYDARIECDVCGKVRGDVCAVCGKIREGVSLFNRMHFDCAPCYICGKARKGVGLINMKHYNC